MNNTEAAVSFDTAEIQYGCEFRMCQTTFERTIIHLKKAYSELENANSDIIKNNHQQKEHGQFLRPV